MSSRLRALRSDESGFTLVELVTAMAIGLVILMAAFLLLDRATAVSQEIANRNEALQRGRLAMEKIVRDLRSQVCLGDEKEPITFADANKVTFYIDTSDGTQPVHQRTIRYDAATKSIYEDIFIGTGVYPDLVFSATPNSTRVLATKVERLVDGGVTRPFFRYYAFNVGGAPGDLRQLASPLNVNDAISTVMVKVGFAVLPDRISPKTREATSVESDIYVRIADPTMPQEGPQCI
jgi:prepilin-type N-terminal cleavage/methylation domain-containing protein